MDIGGSLSMAGEWMKIELSLPDKPEVHRIAGILGIDPDAVVGKLLRVWAWFDQHTENGNAHGVTYSFIDRITCVSGFAEAMCLSGWLEQNDMVLSLPKFDRHSSQSAKTRATTSNRVKKHRKETKQECNAQTVTQPLPEKRREENIKPRRKASPAECELFSKFYAEYPRKEAKANALKAWAKLQPDERVLACDSVGKYARAMSGREPQYIAMPASWINAKRWQDESFSLQPQRPSFLLGVT